MGKLIVIDGIDGSGKGTQCKMLLDELTSQGKNVRCISFPDYQKEGSVLVKLYLEGKLGKNPADTNAYAAASFYAADRYYSYRTDWGAFYHQDNSIIIANRYTTSNAVHQLVKEERDSWDEFVKWLFDYEYEKLGLPKPDMVIYLDVKPEIAKKLTDKRAAETGTAEDIHEKDTDYMSACYKAAQYCADTLGWERIKCDDGTDILPAEDIQGMIDEKVTKLLDVAEE